METAWRRAIELQPDQKEKDRHQAIVDEGAERFLDVDGSEAHLEVELLEEPHVAVGERRVGPDERHRRRHQHHDTQYAYTRRVAGHMFANYDGKGGKRAGSPVHSARFSPVFLS